MAKTKTAKCEECGEMKIIKAKGLCSPCFNKKYNTKPCEECGQVRIIAGRGLCATCYHAALRKEVESGIREPYVKKKKGEMKPKKSAIKKSSMVKGICISCNEEKNIYRNDMCTACYRLFYRPIARCESCGEMKKILAKNLCQLCYSKQKS